MARGIGTTDVAALDSSSLTADFLLGRPRFLGAASSFAAAAFRLPFVDISAAAGSWPARWALRRFSRFDKILGPKNLSSTQSRLFRSKYTNHWG